MNRPLLALLGLLLTPSLAAQQPLHYAESVAMTGHAADAATTFDVRIARFPQQNRGSLWFYVFIDGRQYSLVDESVQLLNAEITQVQAPDAQFAVTGKSSATLAGYDRHQAAMRATLSARGLLHAQAHPAPDPGSIPVEIEATFAAEHTPIKVRAGRIEVMGTVQATLRIDGETHDVTLPGKWHEQTGERPNFAPAFTYLFVQGEQRGLMATRHAAGAWGYVFAEGKITPIQALDIDAYGAEERRFTATLADGTRHTGTAAVVREVSVPIEGRRRPGATVVVQSSLGRMVGVLNDWQP